MTEPHPPMNPEDCEEGQEDSWDGEPQAPHPERECLLNGGQGRGRGNLRRFGGEVIKPPDEGEKYKGSSECNGVYEIQPPGLPRPRTPRIRGLGDMIVAVHVGHLTGRIQAAYQVPGPTFLSRVRPAIRCRLSMALAIWLPQRPSSSTE